MNLTSRSTCLVLVAAIVLLALVGITGRPALAQTIKVAMLGPFTGRGSPGGQEQLNFTRLAFSNFIEATGIAVELVEIDTENDPAKAFVAAKRAVSDAEIVAVIGPMLSQEVDSVYPIFEEAGIAFVSPSATNTALTENENKTFFRVVPRDDAQGPTDAKYMVQTLGATKVFIVDDQTSYSQGLATEVAATLITLGIPFERDDITQQESNFSTLVTKIGASGANVVFIPIQWAVQATGIARELQAQGVEALLFGGDGCFNLKDFVTDAAGVTEGSYVSNFAPDLRAVANAAEVVAQYEAEYGSEFSGYGGPSYAAAQVILAAIQSAGSEVTRETVLAAIAATNLESSVLGIPIAFDEKGDIIGASFFIFKVEGDKFVQVEMPTAATSATAEATASQ